jgi:hypothetical protein
MNVCGGWLRSSSLLSHGPLHGRQRVSALYTACMCAAWGMSW